jgi:Zn-dependent protease
MSEVSIPSSAQGPFTDPQLEAQYDEERRALLEPAEPARGGVLLIATLALFILTQLRSEDSLQRIALLVSVLLFHELGHYAGMRLFGYRDVRMFFIPFFGAAVSGRREGVAAWKEAVVLLLGPLPGIALGVAVLIWNMRMPDPLKRDAAITLLLVNGFNLLPLGGLDGGKLFQRLLFSRHRFLELGFLAAASGGLALLGAVTESWALALFGFLGIVALPRRYRVLRIVRDQRARALPLPADPAQLGDEAGRALFLAARESLPDQLRTRAKAVAAVMREAIEAAQPAPGIGATALLLVGWLSGVAFTLAAAGLVAAFSGPANWQRYEETAGGFAAEYPHPPMHGESREKTPFGELSSFRVVDQDGLLHRYTVEYYDAPAPLDAEGLARWMDERRDQLAAQLEARVVADRGAPGGVRELRLETSRRVWRARLVARGARLYTVTTSSPEATPEGDRFLASFSLLP